MTATARCEFTALGAAMVHRLTTALVDQLSAQVDVDIGILDAIEHPLAEAVEALSRCGDIQAVDVSLSRELHLMLDFSCSSELPDTSALLGDSGNLVSSFFDLTTTGPGHLRLSGPLW